MQNFEVFTSQDIPYHILEEYGLTQQMIDDLPKSVIHQLLSSRRTPVLPIVIWKNDGDKKQPENWPAQISLTRLPDGTVDVCFAPIWVANDLEKFSPMQQELLKNGKTILASLDGKGVCYVQLDTNINQVMTVPMAILERNVKNIAKKIGMDDTDVETVTKGDILEYNTKDGIVSIGIDLNEIIGIRFANGDIKIWEEEAKAANLPKYTFGLYGCWMNDGNNRLAYIKEDDFTKEMIMEQERLGKQNIAEASMRNINR